MDEIRMMADRLLGIKREDAGSVLLRELRLSGASGDFAAVAEQFEVLLGRLERAMQTIRQRKANSAFRKVEVGTLESLEETRGKVLREAASLADELSHKRAALREQAVSDQSRQELKTWSTVMEKRLWSWLKKGDDRIATLEKSLM